MSCENPFDTPDDISAVLNWEREHVWHPYSSFNDPSPVYPVVSARGVRLQLADGRELIDGMASWWSAIHGYRHPVLDQALQQQLGKMAHVMFGGLTHPAAIELSRRLVELTPAGLDRVFLADSGSVAVEVAIKMALQYQIGSGRSGKNRLMTLRGGYHGDTFGAMAVCDPVTGMHHLFKELLPQHLFIDRPSASYGSAADPAELDAISTLFEQQHQQVAAIILEPIVQGAGGMHFYSADYLRHIRALCDRYHILLIHDEIATGFGRTGTLFASEHAGIQPDILCLGKALTGGYMTLAATLCTPQVSDGICAGEAGAFMHGPTFMGNPLACAVACASIDLLIEQDWQNRIRAIESGLRQGLAPAADLPGVRDVRCLGAIGVVELEQAVDMHAIQPRLVEQGIWVRPFGKLVYVMPPYIISDRDLATLTAGIIAVLSS